jgi:hypothetical protein
MFFGSLDFVPSHFVFNLFLGFTYTGISFIIFQKYDKFVILLILTIRWSMFYLSYSKNQAITYYIGMYALMLVVFFLCVGLIKTRNYFMVFHQRRLDQQSWSELRKFEQKTKLNNEFTHEDLDELEDL